MIVRLKPVDTVSSAFGISVPPTSAEDHHTLVDEFPVNTTDYIRSTADDKVVEFEMENLPAGVDRIVVMNPTIYSAGDNPSGDGIQVDFKVTLNGAVLCSGHFNGDNDLGYIESGSGPFDMNILATDWNAGVKRLHIRETVPFTGYEEP